MTDPTPPALPVPELSPEDRERLDQLRELSPRLAQTCENIYRAIARRGELPADERPPTPPTRSERAQRLPLFEEAYTVPNALLRAALFPAREVSAPRRLVKEEPVFAVEGIQVTFSGEEFDQTDLDVLLGILEIGTYVPVGQKFTFSGHALLKLLGR
jgi:hypothetical protein